MPAAIQTAANAGVDNPGFSAILTTLVSRLTLAYPDTATSETVRVIAPPVDKLPEYLAQAGFMIRVSPPVPFAPSGAGRYGYVIERRVDVFVVTQNLSDPGGRDDIAVGAHCTAEETVVESLLLLPPVGSGYHFPVGLSIKWVAPDSETAAIVRQMNKDPGLLVSVLTFAIIYAAPVTVLRD